MGSIGKFVRVDEVNLERENLMFARVLVEVLVDQMFPEVIQFGNEKGYVIEHKVYYAWKPIKCTGCKGYGHNREQCVKPRVIKKVWVKKRCPVVAPQPNMERQRAVIAGGQKDVVDKGQGSNTPVSNRYEALTEATTDELFYAMGNYVSTEDERMV